MVARWVGRLWPLLAVAAIVIAIAVISLFGRLGLHHVAVDERRLTPIRPATEPSQVRPPLGSDISTGFLKVILLVFGLIGGALMLGLLIYLIARWLRKRPRWFGRFRFADPAADVDLDQQRDDVLAAVDAGIAELAADDGDPRAAVIACWVRLGAVAAAAGITTRADATSSDLVASLLAGQQVSADALTSLADLYRTARYSRHLIEAAMRDEARAALQRLRGEIRAVPHGATV